MHLKRRSVQPAEIIIIQQKQKVMMLCNHNSRRGSGKNEKLVIHITALMRNLP